MAEVVPPTPSSSPAPASAPLPVLIAANPPSALTSLPLGTRIEATVLAPGGTGALQIATGLGALAVESRVRLPPEAKLVLELQSLSPRVTLIVASLNGRPFLATDRAGAPSAGTAATGARPGAATRQAAGASTLADPAIVAARLIGAPSSPSCCARSGSRRRALRTPKRRARRRTPRRQHPRPRQYLPRSRPAPRRPGREPRRAPLPGRRPRLRRSRAPLSRFRVSRAGSRRSPTRSRTRRPRYRHRRCRREPRST